MILHVLAARLLGGVEHKGRAFMCPHTSTNIYVSSYLYYSICVLVPLLYMCPHISTTVHVSSYLDYSQRDSLAVWNTRGGHSCVLIPLLLYMCPHTSTTINVSAYLYYYICVLIPLLLYMCPHTSTTRSAIAWRCGTLGGGIHPLSRGCAHK
jgi:hypothetical protein